MDNPYYVELKIEDVDGELVTFSLFQDKNLPLDKAKQLGIQFFMSGYVHQEEQVALAPNFTLYPPTAIKSIRLVSMSIVQTPPGLKLIKDE